MSGEFFDGFYMCDTIKYRIARDRTLSRSEIRASFTEFLLYELEYVDPDLIFAFGNRAWDALRKPLQGTTIGTTIADDAGINTVHGHPFQSTRLVDTHLIPLQHMTAQQHHASGSELDTYMDRLDSGLRDWIAIT